MRRIISKALMEEWISILGSTEKLRWDRGLNLTRLVVLNLAEQLQIKHLNVYPITLKPMELQRGGIEH